MNVHIPSFIGTKMKVIEWAIEIDRKNRTRTHFKVNMGSERLKNYARLLIFYRSFFKKVAYRPCFPKKIKISLWKTYLWSFLFSVYVKRNYANVIFRSIIANLHGNTHEKRKKREFPILKLSFHRIKKFFDFWNQRPQFHKKTWTVLYPQRTCCML